MNNNGSLSRQFPSAQIVFIPYPFPSFGREYLSE
jgi:hypothetical protein